MAKNGSYLVEGASGRSSSKGVFRSASSGGFTTTVMAQKTFEKASEKANGLIRETVKRAPGALVKK